MTAAEIGARIVARLDDAGPGMSVQPDAGGGVPPEVIAAVSEGYQLATMLTLCLETTTPLTLPAGTSAIDVRTVLADYIVPLRLLVGGVRLRPGTLSEFDALDEGWFQRAGTADRYASLGFNLLVLNRQPATNTTAQFTYARAGAALGYNDTPELPTDYHIDLVDYGLWRIRIKEGAQGLARGAQYLNRFLDRMTALGDWVRARSRAARYDTSPCELALFDRSRLNPEKVRVRRPQIA